MSSRINDCFSAANNDYSKSLFRIVSQWASGLLQFDVFRSWVPGSMIASAPPIMIIQNQCFGSWLWASGLLQFDVFGLHEFQDQWMLQYQSNKANNDYSKSLFRIVSQWAASVRCFPFIHSRINDCFNINPTKPIMIIQNQCLGLWASELLQFDVFRSYIPGLTNVSAPPIILI